MKTSATDSIDPKKGIILIKNGRNSPTTCASVNAGAWCIAPFQNGVPKPMKRSLAMYPRKILPNDRTANDRAIFGVSSCVLPK
jgi:hypothetical protein